VRPRLSPLVPLVALLFFFVAFVATGEGPARLLAHSSGPLPGYSGAPGDSDCTLCHTTYAVNSGGATVALTAPTTVVPGAVHTIGVSIANAQNAAKNGFQITARDGAGVFVGTWLATMVPPSFPAAQTQTHPFNAAYHEHTAAGNALASWTMSWTAPATLAAGPVTFYAAVNDADGDASASGDRVYTTSKKSFQASLTTPTTLWPIGGLYSLTLTAPGRAGDVYFIAPSEDPTPFPLGGPFELQVNPLTGMTAFALNGPPGLFIDVMGFVSPSDLAVASVYVPPLPALIGLQLHFAAVTTTPSFAVTEVSNRVTATFQ
jgi:hypothetical protein